MNVRVKPIGIPETEAPRLDGLNYTLDHGAMGIMDRGWSPPIDQIRAATTLCEARHAVADMVEFLLALLDATEPDPDLEPNLAGGHGWGDNPALDDAEEDRFEDEDSDHSGCGDFDGLTEQCGAA